MAKSLTELIYDDYDYRKPSDFDATDEPTQERMACTEPTQAPAQILASAIQRAEAMLPHGIEVTSERNVACRTYEITASCPHCGKSETCSDITERCIEDCIPEVLPHLICEGIHNVLPTCISATCCDPLDRWVDGQRVRELLAWYERWLRAADVHKVASWKSMTTPAQQEVVRTAWSAQLRARQEQARERERNEVCVDDDRWEP